MSAIDLPPGIGLVGTPLGTFSAPKRARRLAWIAAVIVTLLLVVTWYFVSRHPWRRGSSTQAVLPIAFLMFAGLALAVRSAKVAITRDGVRWGWTSLGFTQTASKLACAHVYSDGIALEAKRGSKWFIAERDWDRFDVLVRHLRRGEITIETHAGKAPFRQRLQSYGRFLDGLVITSIAGAFAVMLWAA
jgi:hypothetical protein